VVTAQLCGSISCGGYQCCEDIYTGPACIFQPNLYDCVNGVKLCGKNLGECNGICFNQTLYYCSSGQIEQLPASGCTNVNCGPYPCCDDLYSGPQCYNPSLYTCVNGVKLCGEGLGECNGVCFNPNLYYCNNGQLTQLSPCAQLNCGQYACCNDIYSGPQCYDPTLYSCVNGVKLCGEGLGECNGVCFNQNLYYCNNGQLAQLAPCSQLNCGQYPCCNDIYSGPQCYDSNLYTCVNGVKLCGDGEGECNGICYNDSMYYCNNGVITLI